MCGSNVLRISLTEILRIADYYQRKRNVQLLEALMPFPVYPLLDRMDVNIYGKNSKTPRRRLTRGEVS